MSNQEQFLTCEISSSHGGEYEVQICLLGCTAMLNNCRLTFQRCVLPPSSGHRTARTSETSVDNSLQFTVSL
jgi:hypothetical protein